MTEPSTPGARRLLGGCLVLTMVLGATVAGLADSAWSGGLFTVATGSAWLAASLLFVDISRAQKIQVGVMLLVGGGLLIVADAHGASTSIQRLLGANIGLLTMVTAVGFLRLVALPHEASGETLPVGRQAYLGTLLGTAVLGAVINLSAAILIADRIDHQRPLTRFASQSITRVFTGCAAWSPFFAGMAVVLTYVEGARLTWLMLAGLPFAIVGLAVVFGEALWRYPGEVERFAGYPLRLSSLWIPGLLAVGVLGGYFLLPDVSILILIAASALAITLMALPVRYSAPEMRAELWQHLAVRLPRTANELVLFLAAGILAGGIGAMIQAGLWVSPFSGFDVRMAVALLAIMIAVAAAGIHPLVLIAGATPMLMELDPDPNLLALTFLLAWSLGTSASPLSGTHLVFQGRYGIPSYRAAFWNWPFVGAMFLFAAGWLFLVDAVYP